MFCEVNLRKAIRDLMLKNILSRFGVNNVKKYGILLSNSRAHNPDCSCPIRPMVQLIRDFYDHIFSTKFGGHSLTFVDARV